MQNVVDEICNYFLYALDIVSFIVAVVMIIKFITSIVRDGKDRHRKKKER